MTNLKWKFCSSLGCGKLRNFPPTDFQVFPSFCINLRVHPDSTHHSHRPPLHLILIKTQRVPFNVFSAEFLSSNESFHCWRFGFCLKLWIHYENYKTCIRRAQHSISASSLHCEAFSSKIKLIRGCQHCFGISWGMKWNPTSWKTILHTNKHLHRPQTPTTFMFGFFLLHFLYSPSIFTSP